MRPIPTRQRWSYTVLFCLLISVSFPVAMSTAFGATRDRTAPTTPGSLRVTAKTSYSVSLAWKPASDNSGQFSYRVRHSWGYEATVPQSQTSFTWTGNLEAGRSYSFLVYAVDAAGNKSKHSNTVAVNLPADRIPPTTPVVSVTGVGPTHVALAWASQDDGPHLWYTVYRDGVIALNTITATSANLTLLQPDTTYTFTVQARDFGANLSPLSAPIVVRTLPASSSDTQPPTTPANLSDHGMSFPDGETWLFWEQSTDNVDPPAVIRYDIYVNGVLDHSLAGRGRTILYGTPGASNTFQVIAVDSAGNASAPATLTIPAVF